MYDKERTVEENRIQKVGDKTATNKTSKRSQSNQDDKKFYVKILKSYPHDKNIYLYKECLINKLSFTSLERLVDLWQLADKELLINHIEELPNYDDRKLILAAIKLYNDIT